MKFCPSCGGIVEIPAGMHLMNMHDRLCRCTQPLQVDTPASPPSLTEEQVRALVREEVAKALVAVRQETLDSGKPEGVQETPSTPAKQIKTRIGGRGTK